MNLSEETKILQIYHKLFDEYGPQYWWPGDTALEIILGAILTQAIAWENAEKAINNLKDECELNLAELDSMSDDNMAALLYPSVYFNAKTKKIKSFVRYVLENYDGDLEGFLANTPDVLRSELLGIYGIGEETADDIILYAAGKPSFVIDSYTRRILLRIGIYPANETYRGYQDLFVNALPHDAKLFGEFHALIDEHASRVCHKTRPKCDTCCLVEICFTGFSSVKG